jgi:hypothetical protein
MLIRQRKGIRRSAEAVQALYPNAKLNVVVTNLKVDKSRYTLVCNL